MNSNVIEGATVKVATLVDGTLRVTVDVEPVHAASAFLLLGSPGTPVGIAALNFNREKDEE